MKTSLQALFDKTVQMFIKIKYFMFCLNLNQVLLKINVGYFSIWKKNAKINLSYESYMPFKKKSLAKLEIKIIGTWITNNYSSDSFIQFNSFDFQLLTCFKVKSSIKTAYLLPYTHTHKSNLINDLFI